MYFSSILEYVLVEYQWFPATRRLWKEGRIDISYFFIALVFGLATVWGLMKLLERVMTRR